MKIKTCLFIADQNLKKAKKKSRTDQEQPKKKEVENNAFLDDRWANARSPERMDLDDIKSSLAVSSQNVKQKQQNIAMMTTRVPSKKSKKMQTDQAKTNLRLKSPFKRKIIAKNCKQLNIS